MAHIEHKIVKGHKYYYACRKKRVDGKPRNVWQKYLGTAEDIINACEGKPKVAGEPCQEAAGIEGRCLAALAEEGRGAADLLQQAVLGVGVELGSAAAGVLQEEAEGLQAVRACVDHLLACCPGARAGATIGF